MQALIQEVVGDPQGAAPDSGPLQMMTKDQYANYVVQKMLEVSCMLSQGLCPPRLPQFPPIPSTSRLAPTSILYPHSVVAEVPD